MANIFNFTPKKKKSSDKDFLQAPSELVQFDGAGCDVELPEQEPDLSLPVNLNDWSNQELASIYRVKRLLDAAGVPCHLERGLSDEGDPWCIFCTPVGDVFIHLSRIDSLYVLDSPNLEQPIFGRDFNELIEQFSSGALKGSEKAAQARRRLIRLERNGNVFLHPATLLAALVWSIYLKSEDLVFFVPDEADGFDNDAAVALVASSVEAQTAEDAEMEAAFVSAVAHPEHVISAHMPSSVVAEDGKSGLPFYKEVALKSGLVMVPSAMAVGLSSIAIAFGFMAEGYFEEDSAAQADLGPLDGTDLDVELAEVELEDQTPQAPPGFDLTASLGAVVAQMSAPVHEDAPVLDDLAASVDISELLNVALAMPQGLATPDLAGASETALITPAIEGDVALAQMQPGALKDPASDDGQITVASNTVAPLSEDADVLDIASISSALFSLVDLKDSFTQQLTEFAFGGTVIQASFDIAGLSQDTSAFLDAAISFDMPLTLAVADTDDMMTPATPAVDIPLAAQGSDLLTEFFQRPAGGSLIDDNAISFVSFLMQKDTDLQIISHGDEIVLIDFDAFSGPQSEVLAMSWELEHGGTVQTIGLRTDFAEFDLIA